MRDEEFQALLGAVDEVVEHHHGRKKNLRTTVLPRPPRPMEAAEIRALRERVRASQSVFALALNVGVSTVQAWEAGTRSPDGGNLKLLRLAEAHPDVVFGRLYDPAADPVRELASARKRRAG